MEDITDVDYTHAKGVCKDLKKKKNSASGLAWQTAFKKIKVKLDLLTDIDTLLILVKGITGRICHTIHGYAKANNKYIKDYDKNE